jgi:hypothetical protein
MNRIFVPHIAHWSVRQRRRLVITDRAGNTVATYSVEPSTDKPGHEMLHLNGWSAYPGAEWKEEPEGEWSRSVFPDSQIHGNIGNGNDPA